MCVFPNQEERVGEERRKRRKKREGKRKEGRNERKQRRKKGKRGPFSNTSAFNKVHQSTSPTFIQRVSKELFLLHS